MKLPLARLTLLCSPLLFSTSLIAQTLHGQVVDPQGKVIELVKVDLVGSKKSAVTDKSGQFNFNQLPAGHYELHISAQQYSHKNVHVTVPENGMANFTIELTPSNMEVIDITATPFHASQIESAMPVSVLSGEKLKARQAATLGDTLKNEVGVNTSFYGSVTSSPIIRGLDGPRVLVAQNGLDVGDVSRVGPDHAVATSATSAEQIEILRGPATLFFGSGAIGGVINVVDHRIPKDTVTEGQWDLEYNNGNQAKLASASYKSGVDNFAYYIDGFVSDTENYRVPKLLETDDDHDEEHEDHEHEEHEHEEAHNTNKIENTQSNATGFTLGSSYLLNGADSNGFVGLSYGYLDREYGIPGHEHAHEHEEEEHEEDHDEDEHLDEAEPSVFADMHQHRVQLLSELNFEHQLFQQFNFRMGYTDYQHKEIEGDEVATIFTNKSYEARAELLHQEIDDWRGGFNLHYKQSDFTAAGEEAFTPASTTQSFALALMEEKHIGNWLIQVGGRIENVSIETNRFTIPELELIGQEEHDHEHDEADSVLMAQNYDFNPASWSAGVVWDFQPGYNLALSYSSAQRAPSAAELFSFGPHLAANTYEIGAIYQLSSDEDGDVSFSPSSQNIKLEHSNNIDLSLRKFEGDIGFIFNLFYNQVDNYYYQANIGLSAEQHSEHHEEDDTIEAEEEVGIPIYLFETGDAELYGYEAQVFWQMTPSLKVNLQSDMVRAKLTSENENLPRTPPMRFAANVNYQANDYSIEANLSHYLKQDKVATNETATDGYTLMDVYFNYYLGLGDNDLTLFVKAQNLTDELALVHTSFLKDKTPLAGRNFSLGLRGYF